MTNNSKSVAKQATTPPPVKVSETEQYAVKLCNTALMAIPNATEQLRTQYVKDTTLWLYEHPECRDVAKTPKGKLSLAKCIHFSAEQLLRLDSEVYIVLFKDRFVPIVNHYGDRKIFRRNGYEVEACEIVFKDDIFEMDYTLKDGHTLIHKKNWNLARMTESRQFSNILGAYIVLVNTKTGEKMRPLFVPVEKLIAMRQMSPSWSPDSKTSPWNKWTDDMIYAKISHKARQQCEQTDDIKLMLMLENKLAEGKDPFEHTYSYIDGEIIDTPGELAPPPTPSDTMAAKAAAVFGDECDDTINADINSSDDFPAGDPPSGDLFGK